MSIVVNFVGDRLRRIRMSAGMNGRTLAKEAGIAPAYLTQLEKGKRTPSPDLLKKLASLLGVSIGDFDAVVTKEFGHAREECGLYMADTVETLKTRVADLERQLERSNETIASQARTIEAMQGRSLAAAVRPASGASSGNIRSSERRAGA